MVPLARIRPSEANPRSDFDDERMAELIASVKRHGIITALTLAPDGNGGYLIIAGERRYRAAKAAKLREVPAQVREAECEALTLAVAANVIRADLSPVEEARVPPPGPGARLRVDSLLPARGRLDSSASQLAVAEKARINCLAFVRVNEGVDVGVNAITFDDSDIVERKP